MFPAIMTCLDHYILEGERNRSGIEASNRDVREKADKAKELKGKVMNAEFLLLLSGFSLFLLNTKLLVFLFVT